MRYLLLPVFVLLLFSCGNEKTSSENDAGLAAASSGISGVYEGVIGDKLYIVLDVAAYGDKLEGAYFYKKVGTDIAFMGSRDHDEFSLTEHDAQNVTTGIFKGKIFDGGDSLAGTWSSPDGKRSYAFHLTRSADPEATKIRISYRYFVLSQWIVKGESEAYVEGFSWPEIGGLSNVAVQEQLNKAFHPEENVEQPNNEVWEKSKNLTAEQYEDYGWPHGHTTHNVNVEYYDSRVITWSGHTEWDGGAHPSFGFSGYESVFLATGKPVTAGDLLQGDWKARVLEAIRDDVSLDKSTEFAGSDEPCGQIRDTLLARVKRWKDTQPVYLADGKLIFIADDYRSFGCPEILRDVFEISLDFEQLKSFIKPGSALDKMANPAKKG